MLYAPLLSFPCVLPYSSLDKEDLELMFFFVLDRDQNRKAPMPDSFKQALLQETVGEGPVGGSSKL
jgi:hypothetical protein